MALTEQELINATDTIQHYLEWMHASLSKYAETGNAGHLTGATNSLILICEAAKQFLNERES